MSGFLGTILADSEGSPKFNYHSFKIGHVVFCEDFLVLLVF